MCGWAAVARAGACMGAALGPRRAVRALPPPFLPPSVPHPSPRVVKRSLASSRDTALGGGLRVPKMRRMAARA